MAFPKATKTVLKGRAKDISKTNRDKIKDLFKGKCGLCGKQGVHVHHIEFRSESPSKIDDLDNLFLLCLECHRESPCE